MLIPTLLLSLIAAPEAPSSSALFSCAVTEHSFEASNHSQETLVVSFATPSRRSVLHLALPSMGTLDFSFPEYALRDSWIEVSRLSTGRFISTGALRLPNFGDMNITELGDEFSTSISEGTLLPESISSKVEYPSCARSLDVGVPPPSEDPVIDEVTDLRRRCRRPI